MGGVYWSKVPVAEGSGVDGYSDNIFLLGRIVCVYLNAFNISVNSPRVASQLLAEISSKLQDSYCSFIYRPTNIHSEKLNPSCVPVGKEMKR